MYRPMLGRNVARVSTEYRPIHLSADIVGGIPTFYRHVTDSSPILCRVSVDTSIDVFLVDEAELAKIRQYHTSLSAIMVL